MLPQLCHASGFLNVVLKASLLCGAITTSDVPMMSYRDRTNMYEEGAISIKGILVRMPLLISATLRK